MESITSKKILFINRTSPYGTSHAQEALDALLMASTFNQTVNVLFMDAGVLQLKHSQNPESISQKNFTKTFKALALYDIENVYISETALKIYQLDQRDLITSAVLLSDPAISQLMQQQDTIFSF